MIFFFAYYSIRHVDDQFNINREMKVAIVTKFIVDNLYIACLLFFFNSVFVVLGFVEYIMISMNLILLYFTSITPIRGTYEPNYIVPFPINDELISNLQSAMLMPISSKYFHEYLE